MNVALPNLIAPEIVLTHPMSSMSGYVNYLKFTAGVTKGNIEAGYTFNDPFRLGKVDPNYTSSRVVKTFTASSDNKTTFDAKWTPVVEGTVTVKVTHGGTTKTFVDTAGGKFTEVQSGDSVTRRTVMVQPVADVASMSDVRLEGAEAKVETVVTQEGGAAREADADAAIDYAKGVITFGTQGMKLEDNDTVEVAFSY